MLLKSSARCHMPSRWPLTPHAASPTTITGPAVVLYHEITSSHTLVLQYSLTLFGPRPTQIRNRVQVHCTIAAKFWHRWLNIIIIRRRIDSSNKRLISRENDSGFWHILIKKYMYKMTVVESLHNLIGVVTF